MSKVFIGIGHGGNDPGAVANGLRESDLALSIGLEVERLLKSKGVTTKISRTTDINDDLNDKIRKCNQFAPDLAIDIHINAGGGEGFEAYYYHGGGTSFIMARNIEQEVLKMGQVSRGLKTKLNSSGSDFFGWIRLVNAPSVILEAAFIDNAKDVERIRTEAGRKKFARAYANGILTTLGTYGLIEDIPLAEEVQTQVVYKTFDDVPSFGKPTIQKLMNRGALKGDASGNINIPHEILRAYVVNDRMGLYD